MRHCSIHFTVMTYRSSVKTELFCKMCERVKRSPPKQPEMPITKQERKKWWRFW